MKALSPENAHSLHIVGYYITDDGRVWSTKTGRFLKPWPIGRGYLVVSLCDNGRVIDKYIHHLMAETFIGERPPGMDVCHNDGDVRHNHWRNLRYGTRAENLGDREAHGTAQRGERNPAARLTNEQAEQIRKARKGGESLKELAAAFGVRESTISRIANGVRRAI